jgi:hypothetical protein
MSDVEGSGAEEEVPVSPGGPEGQEAGTVTPPGEETDIPAEIPDTPPHDKTGEPAQTVSEIHERTTEDAGDNNE